MPPDSYRPMDHGSRKPPEKDARSERHLWDIHQTADGFEAVLPGFLNTKKGHIVGTSTEKFLTKAEAETAITEARESVRIFFEQASLEKTYTRYFYRIDQTKDGVFRVSVPGLINTKTGHYVGTTHFDFSTWDEAKAFYLKDRADDERITHRPLLELTTASGEKIAFSDLDGFNPRVAPSEEAYPIPKAIERYLLTQEKLAAQGGGGSTYQETIKEPDWERNLFYFISRYLEKRGVELARRLNVEHLDSLTPKQAIELSTELVIDLTKYERASAGKNQKSAADSMTALQLLKTGELRKNDPSWKGSGVCRNFAATVKAVFEALKKRQTKFSRLRNTYCLFEADRETFAPKRGITNRVEIDKTGHAWNTFVTISKDGGANAVTVDATWAKRNLETKKIENLDYTLERMEPVVNAIGRELSPETPEKDEQLRHILSFYLLKMERQRTTPGIATPEEERQFYATQALNLMTRQGVPRDVPKPLVIALNEEFLKIGGEADPSEIETLFTVSQQHKEFNFSSILREYLKDKPLTDHAVGSLLFKNNELQRIVFLELRSSQNFNKLLVESPKFRIRMRELEPQLFTDFSPTTNTADVRELKQLVDNQQFLKTLAGLIDIWNPSAERIKIFFERARQQLRDMNQDRYDQEVAQADDYDLVKNYGALIKKLKKI